MDKPLSENIQKNTIQQSSQDILAEYPYIKVGTISVVTVIGAILLALFINFLRNRRKDREFFIKYCEKYRSAFIPIKKAVDSGEFSDREILRATYDGIISASIEFKGHLKGKTIISFEQDIKKYKQYYKERVKVDPLEFFGAEALDVNFLQDPDHYKGVAIMRKKQINKHIKTLLSYAYLK